MNAYLADFLKTSPAKSAAILVKKGKKAGSDLNPRSSKITPTKEKDWKKERARRKKGGEEKNSNGCTGCTQVYLAITFSKVG